MADQNTVTGMVLSAMPVGEFDKRVVLLTKERGKISAFARGARRTGSAYLAAANPFAFGTFELYEGKNAYTLGKVEISEYFRNLAEDLEKAWYGFYYLEVAAYYAQEGTDEKERLKLLYQTLRAVESGRFSPALIKAVYEFKTMVFNGEYPDVYACRACGKKEHLTAFSPERQGVLCESCKKAAEDARTLSPSVLYTLQFIASTPPERLYTFRLKEEAQKEFTTLVDTYRKRYFRHVYKSEEFLKML